MALTYQGLSSKSHYSTATDRGDRTAADRARGIDPCPVVPRSLAAGATVRRAFPQYTLEGATTRAALLDLVVSLGRPLRRATRPPAH